MCGMGRCNMKLTSENAPFIDDKKAGKVVSCTLGIPKLSKYMQKSIYYHQVLKLGCIGQSLQHTLELSSKEILILIFQVRG